MLRHPIRNPVTVPMVYQNNNIIIQLYVLRSTLTRPLNPEMLCSNRLKYPTTYRPKSPMRKRQTPGHLIRPPRCIRSRYLQLRHSYNFPFGKGTTPRSRLPLSHTLHKSILRTQYSMETTNNRQELATRSLLSTARATRNYAEGNNSTTSEPSDSQHRLEQVTKYIIDISYSLPLLSHEGANQIVLPQPRPLRQQKVTLICRIIQPRDVIQHLKHHPLFKDPLHQSPSKKKTHCGHTSAKPRVPQVKFVTIIATRSTSTPTSQKPHNDN